METSNPNQSPKTVCPGRTSIVNKVQPIYDDTVKLLDILENKQGIDRDEKIKMINDFLEKRDIEINGLTGPYTDEEMKLGVKLLNLSQRLEAFLFHEKTYIQKDIKDLHVKKKSTQKYSDPYKDMQTGGYFYDKRK